MRRSVEQRLQEQIAFEPKWFKEMTPDAQKTYLKAHPNSQLNPAYRSTQQPVLDEHKQRVDSHPVNHSRVQNALQPNSPERRVVARKVNDVGKRFQDYYHKMPEKQRVNTQRMVDKFVKNKPMTPKEAGYLAATLNKYHTWARNLDEKKLGMNVLKAGTAVGAIGLATTSVGSVGLALGSIFLAGYAMKKGFPFAMKAIKMMTEGLDDQGRRRPNRPPLVHTRPPTPGESLTGDVITPGPGPRPGDHLAAYFHQVEATDDMAMMQTFQRLFAKLAEIAKTAKLSPDQWKVLLSYAKPRRM